MKKIVISLLTISVIIAIAFTACSKDDDPKPNDSTNNDPSNDPDTLDNDPDTLVLFANQTWVTQKVYTDGVEDPNHSLIDSYYTINDDNTYLFTFPGFPSASGTWSFDTAKKSTVHFVTQASGFTWNILSIDTAKLIAEEPRNNGTVRKYEFTH